MRRIWSYLDERLAFIVQNHRRAESNSADTVSKMASLRLGIPDAPYYKAKIRKLLRQAHVVSLDSPRDFFNDKNEQLDAIVYKAEAGSAWTLIYPGFSVAVSHPAVISVPVAYPVPRGEPQFVDFLNSWIALKMKDGSVEQPFNHWIRGQDQGARKTRWSIMRDVLHWTD